VDPCSWNRTNLFKRVVVTATLLAFVACLLPWPQPSPSASGERTPDDDTPYPCQGGHCGCNSPVKCWTSCCCKSPAEREAWAFERGITPPSYAVRSQTATATPREHPPNRRLAAVTRPQSQPSCSDVSSSTRQSKAACCGARCDTTLDTLVAMEMHPTEDASGSTLPGLAKPMLIEPASTRPLATKACCTAPRQEPSATHGMRVVRSKKKSFVLGLSAAKCRGATWNWTHIEWVQPSTWTITLPAESASLWVMQPLFPRLPSIDPDHPPPRGDASPV
jgi:hypothetical protein